MQLTEYTSFLNLKNLQFRLTFKGDKHSLHNYIAKLSKTILATKIKLC